MTMVASSVQLHATSTKHSFLVGVDLLRIIPVLNLGLDLLVKD
jgi:hypothetical protein